MPTFDHACCTLPATWPAADESLLVLAMRRPRGSWLAAVYAAAGTWLKDAGPSDALLDAYRAGDLDWDSFADRYRAELLDERPGVLLLLTQLATAHPGGRLTVLCWERLDAKHPHCHRTLLVDLLRAGLPAAVDDPLPPAILQAADLHPLRVAYNVAEGVVRQRTTHLDAIRSQYGHLPAPLPALAPPRLLARAELLTAQIHWQWALTALQAAEAAFSTAILTGPPWDQPDHDRAEGAGAHA